MVDITVKDLMKHKEQLEVAITHFLSTKFHDFSIETGVGIAGITVQMMDSSPLIGPRTFVVEATFVKMILGD
jgi:hypothetical protein